MLKVAEANYEKVVPSVSATEKQKYIVRYIVNRNEQFNRIKTFYQR